MKATPSTVDLSDYNDPDQPETLAVHDTTFHVRRLDLIEWWDTANQANNAISDGASSKV
jgi:hypothetical protein